MHRPAAPYEPRFATAPGGASSDTWFYRCCRTLLLVALVAVAPSFAQAAADPGKAAQEAARRSDLRVELPRDLGEQADKVARRLDLQRELPTEQEPLSSLFDWHFSLPSLPAGLVYLASLCGVVLLAYVLKDSLPGWAGRHGSWEDDAAAGGEDGPQKPEEAAVAADELARQGRFVEAMHVLLLQGLAEMRQRLDATFADSLTSREILRNVSVPDHGRAALRDIIARVEWTYFGEHPAGPDDYQGCRRSFDVLTQALQGGAQA